MPRLALTLVLCASALAGCDSAPTGPTPAQLEYQTARQATLSALDIAIGERRADDLASCRPLPIGVNNAGRPTLFRLYSLSDGDTATILALGERVNEIDRRAIKEGVLDFPYEAPPLAEIELRDGRCAFPVQVVVN